MLVECPEFGTQIGSMILPSLRGCFSAQVPTNQVTRPGKRLQKANWKMTIEIVDLPI